MTKTQMYMDLFLCKWILLFHHNLNIDMLRNPGLILIFSIYILNHEKMQQELAKMTKNTKFIGVGLLSYCQFKAHTHAWHARDDKGKQKRPAHCDSTCTHLSSRFHCFFISLLTAQHSILFITSTSAISPSNGNTFNHLRSLPTPPHAFFKYESY